MAAATTPKALAGTTATASCWKLLLRAAGPLHHLQRIQALKMFVPEPPPVNVNVPEKYRLPVVPKVPTVWQFPPSGVKVAKGRKDLRQYLGEETVHNTLVLKQFGVVAVSGGRFKHNHFEFMRAKVGRYVEEGRSFAMYRIDAPHKPFTSKGGKRLGGGKGSIKGYATPVKAGRVILEVAGAISWEETHPWLSRIAACLPVEAIAVSQELMARLDRAELEAEERNANPYTLEWAIRNNIGNCHQMLSPYDIKWFGRFTYRDRHNNKKWNLVRQSAYPCPI